MNKIKYVILLICFVLSSCSVEGEINHTALNKVMECRDFRDGESFRFNTNTITKVRIGYGVPSTFKITTDRGESKTLNSNQESYMKCVEKK